MKLILGLLLAGCAFGQVTFTRPVVRGTTVPMSCTITGQLFVDTDGTEGENLYICDGAAFDAYTGTGGGGGADELGCGNGTSAPTTGTAYTCYVRTDTTPKEFWVFVATDTPYLVATIADTSVASVDTLYEAVANGNNFRRVTVPDTLTADLTVRYPNSVPTANNVQCFPAPTADVAEFTWATLDGCNGVVKGNLATKFVCHDTGGDDTYSCNPIGGSGYCPAAYADGLTIEFVADTTNTGAATLDFCGLGALEITAALAGTDLTNGDIVVGKPYLLRYYDAATDLWIVTLPGAGGGGAVSPWTGGNGFEDHWIHSDGGIPQKADSDGTQLLSNDKPYYTMFEFSHNSEDWDSVGLLTGTITGTVHAAVGIYDAGCNLLEQTDTKTLTSATATQFTFASPLTMTNGTYFFAISTDNASGMKIYGYNDGIGMTNVPQQLQASYPRKFHGATSSTGTTTITMPASCGAKTGYLYFNVPAVVALP